MWVEEELHVIVTSTLSGNECSWSRRGRFTAEKIAPAVSGMYSCVIRPYGQQRVSPTHVIMWMSYAITRRWLRNLSYLETGMFVDSPERPSVSWTNHLQFLGLIAVTFLDSPPSLSWTHHRQFLGLITVSFLDSSPSVSWTRRRQFLGPIAVSFLDSSASLS